MPYPVYLGDQSLSYWEFTHVALISHSILGPCREPLRGILDRFLTRRWGTSIYSLDTGRWARAPILGGGEGFDFLSCRSWIRQFLDVSCRSPKPLLWPGRFPSLGLILLSSENRGIGEVKGMVCPSSGRTWWLRPRVASVLSRLCREPQAAVWRNSGASGQPENQGKDVLEGEELLSVSSVERRIPGAGTVRVGTEACRTVEQVDPLALPHPRGAVHGFLYLLSKLWLPEASGNPWGYYLESFPWS